MKNLNLLERAISMGLNIPLSGLFIQEQLTSPQIIDPKYVDAYIAESLARVDLDSKVKSFHGEVSYEHTTPMSVSVVGGNIAILNVKGGLVANHSVDMCGGSIASYEGIVSTLGTLTDDPNITKVIARFSSGGGMAIGAFEASRKIKQMNGKNGTELIAIADLAAYSGAYALMSAFDTRYASHGCGVGSVGVYQKHTSYEKALDKAGVKTTYVYKGSAKIDGAPEFDLSDSQISEMDKVTDAIYTEFTETVANNLGVDVSVVVKTDAKCYTDEQAVQVGFVDAIISFSDLLINEQKDKPMTEQERIDYELSVRTAIEKEHAEAEALKIAQATKLREGIAEVRASDRAILIKAVGSKLNINAEDITAFVASSDSLLDVFIEMVDSNFDADDKGAPFINTSQRHQNFDNDVTPDLVWGNAYD